MKHGLIATLLITFGFVAGVVPFAADGPPEQTTSDPPTSTFVFRTLVAEYA